MTRTPTASGLALAPGGAVRRAMGYRKFASGRPLRVLCFDSGYHLQKECVDALRRLGHHVEALNVRLDGAPLVVRGILSALVRYRPDMVLCINHLGFDDSGTVGGLLEELEVPVACWYVDSPFFVLQGEGMPAAKVTTVFSWERTLLPTLRSLGAQDVHYLPLGCDLNRFAQPPATLRYPVSFVGNSMQVPGKKWTRGLRGVQRDWAEAYRHRLRSSRSSLVEDALEKHHATPEAGVWDALAAATYAATGVYRAELLRALVSAGSLHVFGDAFWSQVLRGATLHPLVAYGAPLAQIYAQSAVNVNATSLQMPSAVNQRVFDVPASGGFLLTDAQDDVGEHFAVGSEAVTFGCAAELAELSGYYRARPQARATVVNRAQEKIARAHTYVHRVRQLVDTMRRRHRARPVGRRLEETCCLPARS